MLLYQIEMYNSTIAALAIMGVACAQTTTDLFLVGFDPQSIVGSIVTSVSSAVSVGGGQSHTDMQ